ncbi:MAG: hypothetical protein EAX89_09380 [Candidatus Lokiarchaeota archaeon]|nr:hypothetical protein [Candidatus Lokiarchaeota archaeon]
MTGQKRKKEKSHPVNYVLLAVSFIIFGSLGIIFVTQMELQPGWIWSELNSVNSMDMYALVGDDVNEDGFPEIISYTDVNRRDTHREEGLLNDIPQFGGIYAIDGLTGVKLWEQIVDNPVKRLFKIMDLTGDGISEYMADIATVGPDWIDHPYNPGEQIPEIFPNDYRNVIINGSDGEFILNATDEIHNYSNFYVHDIVFLDDLGDYRPEFVFIECELKVNTTNEYYCNISSYYLNGTQYDSFYFAQRWLGTENEIPVLTKFPYGTEETLLFVDENSLFLYNMEESNFFEEIYNNTVINGVRGHEVIEDLNDDGYSEILTVNYEGNISILSGIDGTIIRNFQIAGNYSNHWIDVIGTDPLDKEALILVKSDKYTPSTEIREVQLAVYSLTETSEEIIWRLLDESRDETKNAFVIHEDLNGDRIEELIVTERITPIFSTSEVRRITVTSVPENQKLAILNIEYDARYNILTIPDLDGDGKKDFSFPSNDRILALSSAKPLGLWLSSSFSWGFPVFITLVVFLGIGLLIFAIKGRKVSYKREGIKEHKLTIVVNTITIGLMTVAFALFLLQLNVFNRTLISGDNMTTITNVFLIVTIAWYGMLPLTAALYNRFAPSFAFLFVKLRRLFFKISRHYNTDIIVLDMEERKEIGTLIQLKRVVLPLLLSIATGFYAYNALTPILGFPQDFEVFGSTEFFQFMNGYMLCCIFPMILAFIVFSFFISGNFLLDDAGVVYFKQSKKYRQPADIEPISVWAQSLIKGIAGLSAIITLVGFLATVDFSGFFSGEEILNYIFGMLMIIVFFAGIPFLTAFSYILLAGEIMEFSMDYNINKLYKKMEKHDYNTTPRKITNLYPSGYSFPNKEELNNTGEDVK